MTDTPTHVLRKRCATCIYTRNGELMHLQEGRVEKMTTESIATDSNVVCHQSKSLTGNLPWDVWCYGSYETVGPGQMMRITERLGLLEWVDPPTKEKSDD